MMRRAFLPFLLPFAGAFTAVAPQFHGRTSLSTHVYGTTQSDVGVQLAQQVHQSVALVTPMGVRNMTTRGSGFVIDFDDDGVEGDDDDNSYTYLITAAHVAAPGYEIGLAFPDELESRPATIIGRNLTLDLALLRIDGAVEGTEPLSIATDLAPVGTTAFAHGYPASRLRGPAMTTGIVCGIADGLGVPDCLATSNNDDTTTFVVTDAAMSGGMSGGPLTDTSGAVLGVNALVRPDLRALGNYAVSSQEVLAFLEQVSNAKDGILQDSKSDFQVFLFNDPMNKKARVSSVLGSIAKMKDADANKVMMEAHSTGKGVIGTFQDREAADDLCQALKKEDLLVEVQ